MAFQNAPIIPTKRRYKRLFQDDCFNNYSTEDEEVVLYEKQDAGKQELRQSSHVTFSLSDLELPKQPLSALKWREKVASCLQRIHMHCFTTLLVILFVIAAAIVIPTGIYFLVGRWIEAANAVQAFHNFTSQSQSQHPTPTPSVPGAPSHSFSPINFTAAFPHTMSLTSPAFVDVNGDSVLDVVFAATVAEADHHYTWYCEDSQKIKEQEEKCQMQAGHFYPCGSHVMALSGNNGSILWEHKAFISVFAIACAEDLNGDGIPDCMLCGRMGYWHAIDGNTGEYLWDVDHSIVNVHYNFFYPTPVGDLNADGVVDFANIHSVDPRYGPEEHLRPPGMFVVISGKNGEKLMDPIFVPDMKESYMNPIRYKTEEEDFILFGSGGETIEGGLWAVTMSSLKDRVNLYLSKQDHENAYIRVNSDDPHCKEFLQQKLNNKPVVKINHTQYIISESLDKEDLNSFYRACPKTVFHPVPNVHHMCIYRVVYSPEKGVILPPVVLDMNGDNIDDLVISLYAGHTLVMDGSTGQVLWDRYIPGTESYSIPAPFFFNEDTTPDFFIRVSKGTWAGSYSYSYVGIVDGQNGELLWALNSSRVGFMSASTLRAQHPGEDAVLFMTIGQLPTDSLDKIKLQEIVTVGSISPHVYDRHEKRSVSDKQDHSRSTFISSSAELDHILGSSRFARASILRSLTQGLNPSDNLNHFNLSTRDISPSKSMVTTSQVAPSFDANVFTSNSHEQAASNLIGDYRTKSALNSAVHSTSMSGSKPATTPSTEAIDFDETITFTDIGDISNIVLEKGLVDFSKHWEQVFKYNPKTEPEKFIYKECSIEKSPVYMYFLTPRMIIQKKVEPFLTVSGKIAFVESNRTYSTRLRRHGTGGHDVHSFASTFTLTLQEMVHTWGCSNVLSPGLMVATPAMVDLNGDGQVELVYLKTMNREINFKGDELGTTENFPDEASIQVVTLKSILEVNNPDLSTMVNFNTFLPYPEQPWAQYMGRNQDSIYSS